MQFNQQDHRRRSLGLFLLMFSVVATVWGRSVLQPYLEGLFYLFYWSFCLLCLLFAILVALVDMAIIGIRCRAARKDLLRKLEQFDDPRIPAGRPDWNGTSGNASKHGMSSGEVPPFRDRC